MLGVRKRGINNDLFLWVGYNQALVPSHPLKQEELIARAHYNKQKHSAIYFLGIKGKLQGQETPAQRNQNLHEKKYNCQRANFMSQAS